MHVAFLQPFGLSSPGGGSRILRALLMDAPVRWTSICTGLDAPPKAAFGNEIHLRTRPSLGRLDRSRYRWIPDRLEPLFGGWFARKLELTCRQIGVTALHSIPHGLDFVLGWRVARQLGLKFILNVHDDVLVSVGNHASGAAALEAMPAIWREADARFVISEQMGREYCARYGQREFEVVTDGLERLSEPRSRIPNRLHLYFMGLFHIRYEPNLTALLGALDILRAEHPGIQITATFRCGSIRESVTAGANGLRVLPFGTEADVETDLQDADLLYMPLPFTAEDACFVHYSLSTKMITYLGSGIPMVYHGPRDAAAFEILSENNAAFVCCSLEPEVIASLLREAITNPPAAGSRVESALNLAKRRFMLDEQRSRFWNRIEDCTQPAPAVTCTAGNRPA
jgi:glycosyltransferase involved in cell wall biosynthesis